MVAPEGEGECLNLHPLQWDAQKYTGVAKGWALLIAPSEARRAGRNTENLSHHAEEDPGFVVKHG